MSETEDKESTPLTPEQRIQLLEGKVGKNRIGLMFLGLILVVALSASITAFMIYYFGGPSGASNGDEIYQKLEAQAEILEQYDVHLANIRTEVQNLDNRINNTSNHTLQRVLIEQEQAKQRFMDTVRSAIYDLAHMVPGSRSWLELYTEQLDDATTKSQMREKQLRKLETSEPMADKDPFFDE